ncbi:twin-arginine translocase TatA/TatE family subunit, partial [Weissella cibaria]|nr:twin-arginine translocase TatA/TatE family subunit [Weissella cibaria]
MLMIALVIVVLFGPNKIPEIARGLGQGVRKMKDAMEDVKSEIMKETDNPVSEIKREIEKVKKAAQEYDPTEKIKQE